MPKKKQPEKEVSLADLAKKALDGIIQLSKSQLISEKLQSMNQLLFVFIITTMSTYFLVAPSANELTFAVFLIVSFIFGLIINLGYAPVLAIVTNFASNKIEGLRAGLLILCFSLTSAIAALTIRLEFLITISGVLILVQLLVVAFSGVILPKISIKDTQIEPNQIWAILNKISILTGIISFVIDIILVVLKISL